VTQDSQAPTVAITTPANGLTDVTPGTAIVLTFSEPVRAADLPTTNTQVDASSFWSTPGAARRIHSPTPRTA
jgi:hypothetical protein